MTLQQLPYFREIAITLNFTRAAENLYVSQSNLSHSINLLERELGAPLFLRQNGKKIVLTTYGNELLPYAESILCSMDLAKERIQQLRDPVSGVVRIAYGYVNGVPLVSELFKQYYCDYPDRNISLQFQINDGTKVIEQLMRDGETDLAFIAAPCASPDLECVPVAVQELVVMLPKEHPLSCRDSLRIEDIKSEPLLAYHPQGNLVARIKEMFADCGYIPSFLDYLSGWMETVTYIAMGQGISILPQIPVNEREIAVIPLNHPMAHRQLYLYWPVHPKISPAAEFIRQYCVDYFKKPDSPASGNPRNS